MKQNIEACTKTYRAPEEDEQEKKKKKARKKNGHKRRGVRITRRMRRAGADGAWSSSGRLVCVGRTRRDERDTESKPVVAHFSSGIPRPPFFPSDRRRELRARPPSPSPDRSHVCLGRDCRLSRACTHVRPGRRIGTHARAWVERFKVASNQRGPLFTSHVSPSSSSVILAWLAFLLCALGPEVWEEEEEEEEDLRWLWLLIGFPRLLPILPTIRSFDPSIRSCIQVARGIDGGR